MPFTVRVRENSHSMDEGEAYDLPAFATYAEAEAACRRIVDDFLTGNLKPGLGAEALFRLYTTFGEDPAIDGPGPSGAGFSAWDYARGRCDELCRS